MSAVEWSVTVGRQKGKDAPVSVTTVGTYETKREAYRALMAALGGRKPVTGILRLGHTYFAIPSDR